MGCPDRRLQVSSGDYYPYSSPCIVTALAEDCDQVVVKRKGRCLVEHEEYGGRGGILPPDMLRSNEDGGICALQFIPCRPLRSNKFAGHYLCFLSIMNTLSLTSDCTVDAEAWLLIMDLRRSMRQERCRIEGRSRSRDL